MSPRVSPGTNGEYTQQSRRNVATSYNGDSAAFACAFCGEPLSGQQTRFCSHACYSASITKPISQRIWSRVRKTDTCWIWTGARTGSGSVQHGQIAWRERYASPQRVHRVVWELTHGPIPDGKQVNHTCDNPVCVRLDHLYLGTQDDNMKDAARRGRLTVPRSRTLSLFDRLAIYRAVPYRGVVRDLARRYGVTKSCISIIRSGRFIGSGVWLGTKEAL